MGVKQRLHCSQMHMVGQLQLVPQRIGVRQLTGYPANTRIRTKLDQSRNEGKLAKLNCCQQPVGQLGLCSAE